MNVCPPAQLYSIVMAAVVLFNLYRGTYGNAIRQSVALVIGAGLLWILCAANMSFVAYGLLILPLLFFVFFLAIVFYDQTLLEITSIDTRGRHGNETVDCGCQEVDFCDC